MRGYGGSMKVAFFPKSVNELMKTLGFKVSKKGSIYKNYNDGSEEIQAFPKCVEKGEKKGVTWYIRTLGEPSRPVQYEEALVLSMEFNRDVEQIQNSIAEYNGSF